MDSVITRTLILLTVLLAIVIVIACGGDDDDDDTADGASLEVTTTADADERDGELSFREAMALVSGVLLAPDMTEEELDHIDGNPGIASADTITFGLEDDAVIELEEALPALNGGNDIIDGAGEVTIDGSAADFTCIDIGSQGNAVYGLRFVGCRTAIHLTSGASNNTIGAPGGQGNVFIDGVVGIQIDGRDNLVQGNHIGVEPDGTEPHGNEFEGIWISRSARENKIGGPGEGEGNIISGNQLFGISIDGARGTIVQGNYFGLDTSGRVGVRNHTAIKIATGAFDNLIGGSADGELNVISGNGIAIRLTDEATTGNRIIGNIFGKSAGQGEGIPNDEDIYEDPGVGENEIADNIID